MKKQIQTILKRGLVIGLVLVLLFFPNGYFYLKDCKFVGKENSISVEPVNMQTFAVGQVSLEEKIQMIHSTQQVTSIELEAGELYSLHEARMQSYRELCEIPMLNMSISGPLKDDIKIKPYLVINPQEPSMTMIVWEGRLAINEVLYEIVLEEESGKLLKIEAMNLPDSKQGNQFGEKLQEEWKEYIQGS